MSAPLVSIIIPVYNREELIRETLNSVLEQSYINWECILIDDGSTDATAKIVLEYCKLDTRFNYYKRPSDRLKGANACRNYGFEVSKGAYIQWFDSDDLMHTDKLKQKVASLCTSTADFVVCEGVEFKDAILNVIHHWDSIYSKNVLLDHIVGNVNFHTNGPLFKREFLATKHLFDETLQRKQEWEFYSRLLTFSTNYNPLKVVLYYFRIHKQSINGLNDIKTLNSRIKATNLVFRNSIQYLDKNDLKSVRSHFFNKQFMHFKLARSSKNMKLIFYSIQSIFLILNLTMFFEGIGKLFRNPQILKNMLK